MPAARTAVNLLPGMQLAEQLGCDFVALCSGQTQIKEAVGLAREVPGLSWTLVELQEGWSSQLLDFCTARFEAARSPGAATSARSGTSGCCWLEWSAGSGSCSSMTTFGRTPSWSALRRLRCGQAGRPACPRRLSGQFGRQPRAAGGRHRAGRVRQRVGAAVDTSRIESFFPDVYNEDWLFLFDAVGLGQVWSSGVVSQEKYDPFADSGAGGAGGVRRRARRRADEPAALRRRQGPGADREVLGRGARPAAGPARVIAGLLEASPKLRRRPPRPR